MAHTKWTEFQRPEPLLYLFRLEKCLSCQLLIGKGASYSTEGLVTLGEGPRDKAQWGRLCYSQCSALLCPCGLLCVLTHPCSLPLLANHRLKLTSCLFFSCLFLAFIFSAASVLFHQPHCSLVRPTKRVYLCTPCSCYCLFVSWLQDGLFPFTPCWVLKRSCLPCQPRSPDRWYCQWGRCGSSPTRLSGLQGERSVSRYPRPRAPFHRASFSCKAGRSLPSSLMCFSCSFSRLSSLSLGDSAPERKSPSHHRQPSDTSETAGKHLLRH